MTETNILVYDIECTNLKSDFGVLLCIGYKWLHEKRPKVISVTDYPNWRRDLTNSRKLLKDFTRVYEKADLVVTYNGKMFDQKWLNGKLWHYGMPLLPPTPHVDLYQASKTHLNASRKSLQNLAKVGQFKTSKEGVEGNDWLKASTGHLPSIKSVIAHCKADIEVTEEFYYRMRPFIRQHPRVGGRSECRSCGAEDWEKRGKALTINLGPRLKLRCRQCGSWENRPV